MIESGLGAFLFHPALKGEGEGKGEKEKGGGDTSEGGRVGSEKDTRDALRDEIRDLERIKGTFRSLADIVLSSGGLSPIFFFPKANSTSS